MSKIPKVIHQTWKDTKLTGLKKEIIENTRKWGNHNPDWEYKLYGNIECVAYLDKHFPSEKYAWAFEQIVPGAFKADLFRYALLYNEGGVYLDIDTAPLNFSLDEMLEIAGSPDFLSVREAYKLPGIWQAFIACVPGMPFLKIALDQIVENVENRWYPPPKMSLTRGKELTAIEKGRPKDDQTKQFFQHMGAEKLGWNQRWGSNFSILSVTGPTLLASCMCKWWGQPLTPIPWKVEHQGYTLRFFYLAPRPGNTVKFYHKDDPVKPLDYKTDVFISTAEEYDERSKDSYYAEAFKNKEIYKIASVLGKRPTYDELTSSLTLLLKF
jgi:hypothetical protein